jgi:putative transposase
MINFLFEQLKKDEEIASLNSLINSNPDPRELKRALAVLRAIEGHPYRIISQMLGVSEFFVGHWKKAFKAEGLQGIKLGYQGKKGYLDPNQLARTIEWLTSKEYWHLEDLVNYLDRRSQSVCPSRRRRASFESMMWCTNQSKVIMIYLVLPELAGRNP